MSGASAAGKPLHRRAERLRAGRPMQLVPKPFDREQGSVGRLDPKLCGRDMPGRGGVMIKRQLIAKGPQRNNERQPAKLQGAWLEPLLPGASLSPGRGDGFVSRALRGVGQHHQWSKNPHRKGLLLCLQADRCYRYRLRMVAGSCLPVHEILRSTGNHLRCEAS